MGKHVQYLNDEFYKANKKQDNIRTRESYKAG